MNWLRRISCVVFLLVPIAVNADAGGEHWIGTWAASPQHWLRGRLLNFQNATVRLIVHTSAGGKKVRIRVSNAFGDQPLVIGSAHIARRATGADIDPVSDRALTFRGQTSATVAAHATIASDPVELDVAPLSDLAISLYFPEITLATTTHVLAAQTNYLSPAGGDTTAAAKFTVARKITSWPFLSGVDVTAPAGAASIVAFGSSTTDGDGSTTDTNHRWPNVLAERLQKCGGESAQLGVLNEGIIGNRLLRDTESPHQTGGAFGAILEDLGISLGEAGVKRFDRDVVEQPGVKYVVLVLGINDILFPGSFTPATEGVTAKEVIDGNRQLVARAHKKGMRVIMTTIPPFEGATFDSPAIHFSTPDKESMRQQVNEWIRRSGEFDGMVDFDAVLRDPGHPARLLPAYDSGDHLHANDAGYVASAEAVPLGLFGCGQAP